MNSKIKLAIAAASAAGAAASLIAQSPALAGGLSSTQTNNYGAAATYNLGFGGAFSATGNTTSTVTPFALTTGALSANGATTASGVIQTAFTEGNAGTSTLTASFDNTGFATGDSTSSSLSTPSFAVQAGVVPLGSEGATGNVTTAVGTKFVATTPKVVAFSTAAGGAAGIILTGAGLNNGVLSASVSGTDIGAATVQGSLIQGLTVLTTLSAF